MADQNVDWGKAESDLKDKSGKWYDPTMLDDLKRNTSNNGGGDVTDWTNRIANKSQLRENNAPNSDYVENGQGGYTMSKMMGSPSGGSGGGSGAQGGWNGGGTANQGRSNDLYNTLLGRSQQSLNVDPNDPIIANQVNSYKAQQTRSGRNYIDQLAEAGGPNRNLGTEQRMVAESGAQGAGALQASLVGNELTARRGEIQNALTQMGSQLSDDQHMALQHELAMIDANLRSRGLDIQQQLGMGQLDLSRVLGMGQLGLGQGQLGLAGQQLQSNNDQFTADYQRGLTNDANHWDLLRRGVPGA